MAESMVRVRSPTCSNRATTSGDPGKPEVMPRWSHSKESTQGATRVPEDRGDSVQLRSRMECRRQLSHRGGGTESAEEAPEVHASGRVTFDQGEAGRTREPGGAMRTTEPGKAKEARSQGEVT